MARHKVEEQYNKAAWEKFNRTISVLTDEHEAKVEAIEYTIREQLDEEHRRYKALADEAHRVLIEETDAWFAARRRDEGG